MATIGRNEPCPCGSGKKYKKCCLATSSAPYTQADRETALQMLLGAVHPDDMDAAREQLWGKHLPVLEKWKDPALLDMAECALQGWVCFDELDDGETHAEDFLDRARDLGAGVRRYIETGRASAMKAPLLEGGSSAELGGPALSLAKRVLDRKRGERGAERLSAKVRSLVDGHLMHGDVAAAVHVLAHELQIARLVADAWKVAFART